MYEGFTDRARQVMKLADEAAKRLNHEYIGTEHILIGLVDEGKGVAAHVLRNLKIESRAVQACVEKFVLPGRKRFWLPRRSLTPRSIQAIEKASQESQLVEHNYVGTEHLLLGLIADPDGVALHVLLELSASPIVIRKEVLKLLG